MNKYYYGHKKNNSNVLNEGRPRLLSEDIRSTYYLLISTLAVMLIVCVLSYLYISSQKAAKGYLLQELQNNYESLTSESKELDTKLLDAQSLTNMTENDEVTNMNTPDGEDEFTFIENDNGYAQN
ncbi:MAG: hypothetical protein ACD_51C00021G0002 [uncultured bacterium]|nr:MAG: hypothetical protein ACD_51C00021G0002 [uncultured bacterium]OGJ47573.1 MAG: hypothetical protein A2244_00720 [Candidatus Peregrinibacteria bacterium RIFOXYA2_FULL_41_18]OGJ49626.1 MAG: hypothetical protein A2344_02390 [Candidatus Peregrinibacteria bacterium RIFOXYB12_FULL_41_12]OGJ53146.1 MAG: hypothetical protein A2448_03165 [Candidatus Peregrinibacteria bacterium RIFOXYC2_FULL_41_22]